MKKLIYLFILISFSSCLGSKKVIENTDNKKETEKTEIKIDSTSKTEVNKSIDDKVVTPISDTGDEFLDAKIDEILSKLNTQKSSGSNNYKLYYDTKLRELRAEFKVGETKNVETETSNETKVEKTLEQTITETSKTIIRILPWWAWLIIIWILRNHIINIIGVFVPGVKSIKTVNDLLNPPNKNES